MSALEVNVLGTRNVLAHAPEGSHVVTASTCKACEPETAYGASKLVAERVTLNAGGSVARFYNVVESSGNVFEIWSELDPSEPLEVTPCRRYFISLAEAVSLVVWTAILPPARYGFDPGQAAGDARRRGRPLSRPRRSARFLPGAETGSPSRSRPATSRSSRTLAPRSCGSWARTTSRPPATGSSRPSGASSRSESSPSAFSTTRSRRSPARSRSSSRAWGRFASPPRTSAWTASASTRSCSRSRRSCSSSPTSGSPRCSRASSRSRRSGETSLRPRCSPFAWPPRPSVVLACLAVVPFLPYDFHVRAGLVIACVGVSLLSIGTFATPFFQVGLRLDLARAAGRRYCRAQPRPRRGRHPARPRLLRARGCERGRRRWRTSRSRGSWSGRSGGRRCDSTRGSPGGSSPTGSRSPP